MPLTFASSHLFKGLFSTPEMAAIFSDESYLAKLIAVEAALAKAQAKLGVIPNSAAEVITQKLATFSYELAPLAEATERASIPTIALLSQLREHIGTEAASYLHWGATSQDVMDTALVLQIREGLAQLQEQQMLLIKSLAAMAEEHQQTLMAGRTHSQQALPITFGFKVVSWLGPHLRHLQRLSELKARVLMVQFGGAVGSLASLGQHGGAVQEELAKGLLLGNPLTPWHSQRDTIAELAGWLSLVTGSLAKMAQDIILMAQTEIAEVRESDDPTRGGSSTMPQKSNPVQSELIITTARHNSQLLASMHQAVIQEHERGTHGWQLEWLALPQMFQLTASALHKANFLGRQLVINKEQMLANIKASQGLMLAEFCSFELAKYLPRAEAKELVTRAVQEATRRNAHLVDTLASMTDTPLEWARLKDERAYLGLCQELTKRVLSAVADITS